MLKLKRQVKQKDEKKTKLYSYGNMGTAFGAVIGYFLFSTIYQCYTGT